MKKRKKEREREGRKEGRKEREREGRKKWTFGMGREWDGLGVWG